MTKIMIFFNILVAGTLLVAHVQGLSFTKTPSEVRTGEPTMIEWESPSDARVTITLRGGSTNSSQSNVIIAGK